MDEKGLDHRTRRHSHHHHPSPLLRTLLLLLRILILLCSLFLLGLFIFRYIRRSKSASTLAILILSAISSAWSFLSLLSTCCGHTKVASFMALIDLVHVGAAVAIAVLLRDYASTGCGGTASQRRDCRLLRAAFGIAVGLAALYALSTLLSLLLVSAFRRARPYGPSPDNDYSAEHNPAPIGKRRGYISPTLPAVSGSADHDAGAGYRHSTYTSNSAVTDPGNGTVQGGGGGSLRGRDSAEAGLLAPPPPHQPGGRHGQGFANRQQQGIAGKHYEPYRSPTPVGGQRQSQQPQPQAQAGTVDMPAEGNYGGLGRGTAF